MKPRLAVLLLLVCFLSFPVVASAQWERNGAPVSNAYDDQSIDHIIPDGAGGAIMVWNDYRNGHSDIYAQKIDAHGMPKWALDGVAVCSIASAQDHPVVVSDGAGGCIVAWDDYRSGGSSDIYAQRINSAGVAQWAANGVVISAPVAGADQWDPVITTDGSGGAIIAWHDTRNGPDDIYAQRVNSAGVVQWASHGKSVCIAAQSQQEPRIITDGANGAIVTWMDYRSGLNYDVYVQRMNSGGSPSWAPGGVGLCTLSGEQAYPELVSDGAGGAIVVWQDGRSLVANDIFAQRVNSSGAPLWAANGLAVSSAIDDQNVPAITTDGSGGAIVAWADFRDGPSDIYVRRVSAAGVALWENNGVPVCKAANYQVDVTIDTDNAGGAVMTWIDQRSGISHIYAQRVKHTGVILWEPDGMAVNDRPEDNYNPRIVSDGAGGGIVAWRDQRNANDDVYAQRVEGRFGGWGHPEPTVTSVADVRADQGGRVKVNWKASGYDAIGVLAYLPVNYYTIWRATDAVSATISKAPGASSTLVVDDPSQVPADYAGKAIYVQHSPLADYYWELVGTQSALKVSGYSFSAETRADSVAGNTATHQFMVAANTPNEFTAWPSNSMSGHSVDNLAPPAPLFLEAYRAGSSVVLSWNRVRVPDIRDYSVYRATSSGVTPIPLNFLAGSDDTVLVDTNAPTSVLYYIVTANDVHANQGAASNEASVSASTGVGNLPPITALMVMQNRPNPFATSSTFEIGLPAASRVEVEVFDVAGRRVSAQSLGTRSAGWQTIALDATDAQGKRLASGVYFYRIHAAGQSVTRKMVITR